MKLKNFFVEEVPSEPVESTYDYAEEETIDVNTENVSQDNLISDIYDHNNLSDLSKSIFKVEELVNSLPKEMPKETKKTTVLSILTSFGLSVEEVITDADNRITVIKGALGEIKSDNDAIIEQNNQDIETKKVEIQALEKDNSDRTEVIKNTQDKTEEELKRIDTLIKFIGGNE